MVPTQPPTLTGPWGMAWHAPPQHFSAAVRKAWPAGVDSWLLYLPQAHPIWPVYHLSAVTLADLPGLPAAHRYSPEMTHDLLLVALDPEQQINPDDPLTWKPLTPVNLGAQRHGTDEDIPDLMRALVERFLNGMLVAETADYGWARVIFKIFVKEWR